MATTAPSPDDNFKARFLALESQVAKLSTQDVLLNATFGPGLTVAQAYAQLLALSQTATAQDPTTNWTTATDSTWVDTGATITYTVTRTSIISITYTARTLLLTGTGAGMAYTAGLNLDGAVLIPANPDAEISVGGAAASAAIPVALGTLATIAPGAHIIKAQMQRFASSSSPSNSGSRLNGLLTVHTVG
jgi:hypothetical protein